MTTYNGWANYETWRVNLEIFDGMELQADLYGMELSEAADWMKEFAEELIEQSTSEGIGRDYALAFINHVDWREIAEHYVEIETDEEEIETDAE